MVKFILKKYYLYILISMGLLLISIVLVKNLYVATILTIGIFVALPYYLVKNTFITFNQNKGVTRNFAKDGFLGGGVVNFLMSSVWIIEIARKLFLTILAPGNQPKPFIESTAYSVVFAQISTIVIFPCIMFFIGGVSGWFGSHPFRKRA